MENLSCFQMLGAKNFGFLVIPVAKLLIGCLLIALLIVSD